MLRTLIVQTPQDAMASFATVAISVGLLVSAALHAAHDSVWWLVGRFFRKPIPNRLHEQPCSERSLLRKEPPGIVPALEARCWGARFVLLHVLHSLFRLRTSVGVGVSPCAVL